MSQQTTFTRTSDVTRSPGTLMVVQSSSTFQEQLFEQGGVTIPRTKMEQHDTSLDSSTHGEMMKDETTELKMTEKPTLQTSAQSNTRPFPPLSTSETLSSASPQKSSQNDDIGQSIQPKTFFPSQSPLSGTSDISRKAEEHLHEGMNSMLLHAVDYQTTIQTPLFNLSQMTVRESSSQANLHKTTNEDQPSPMAFSEPQPSSVPPSVYDRSQVSRASTFSLTDSTASHGRNTMSSFGTSSHVNSPSTAMSVPTRHNTQGMSVFQQLYMLSTVHGEQTSVPFVIDPEALLTSSAPVPTTLQEPDVHISPERSDLLLLPQSDSDPTDIASALTKTTSLNLASSHVGLNSSVAGSSTLSTSRAPPLSTLANREQGTTVLPSQVNEQVLSNTASSHVELDVPRTPSIAGLEIPSPSSLDHTRTKLSPSVSISFYTKTPRLPGQVLTNSQPPHINPPVNNEHPLSTLSTIVPSQTSSQIPSGSVTVMDESHLLVTSPPAHAITETNGTAAEGGLPVDAEPHTTDIFTTSKAPSQASSPPIFMEHALLDASAHPGIQRLTHNETQTPNPSFSTTLQLDSFNMTRYKAYSQQSLLIYSHKLHLFWS
nr:PREDICTED: mucin-4-like [Anolis carolinensis]|eukprot:XP_016852173.1 PREDICTED: mucin-4-like [Anolis carolinensis]